MSMPEAIAFCALVLGIIAVAGIMFDAYKHRISNRVKELEAKARLASAGTAEIEQRLRVLERIATDKDQQLADEIEELRAPRALENS